MASLITMQPSSELNRRELIKTLGLGLTAVSIGLASLKADPEVSKASPPLPAKTDSSGAPPQPFTLPALPYAYDALEPLIDARTMEIHHTKHHQAYVDGANRALAEYPELQKLTGEALLKDLSAVPERSRSQVRNMVGGHVNHSLFWRTLSPHGQKAPTGALATAIEAGFGSFDAFKARLTDIAMKRFGSGWAWLAVKKQGGLELFSLANQDSPYSEGLTPILGLDVWEHAYYLHYQNRRLDYVEALQKLIDWKLVGESYVGAQA